MKTEVNNLIESKWFLYASLNEICTRNFETIFFMFLLFYNIQFFAPKIFTPLFCFFKKCYQIWNLRPQSPQCINFLSNSDEFEEFYIYFWSYMLDLPFCFFEKNVIKFEITDYKNLDVPIFLLLLTNLKTFMKFLLDRPFGFWKNCYQIWNQGPQQY